MAKIPNPYRKGILKAPFIDGNTELRPSADGFVIPLLNYSSLNFFQPYTARYWRFKMEGFSTDILHLGYNGVGVRAGLGHLGLGLDQLKVLPPLIVRSPFLTLQLH